MTFPLILTVKKKCSAGLKLSNLMNLGRKKSTSLEPPDRSLETSSKTYSRLQDQRAGRPPGAVAGLREDSSDSEGRSVGSCCNPSLAGEPTAHSFC